MSEDPTDPTVYVVCPNCDGRGLITTTDECLRCGGSGKIEENTLNPGEPSIVDTGTPAETPAPIREAIAFPPQPQPIVAPDATAIIPVEATPQALVDNGPVPDPNSVPASLTETPVESASGVESSVDLNPTITEPIAPEVPVAAIATNVVEDPQNVEVNPPVEPVSPAVPEAPVVSETLVTDTPIAPATEPTVTKIPDTTPQNTTIAGDPENGPISQPSTALDVHTTSTDSIAASDGPELDATTTTHIPVTTPDSGTSDTTNVSTEQQPTVGPSTSVDTGSDSASDTTTEPPVTN